MTRVTKTVLIVGLLLAVVVGVLLEAYWDEIRALVSIRTLDNDYPLFAMHYYGDYDLEGLRPNSPSETPQVWRGEPSSVPAWACTCFSALNDEGHPLFGRNFDWHNHAALVLFSHPRESYASVTMVDITYLGFSADEYQREGRTTLSWPDRLSLLDAPTLPFDGMNECGLAVGCLAVPDDDPGGDPSKGTVDSLMAMRLLLDHARDVDEAISLLERYNLDFDEGPHLHYLIGDAQGDSAVVEFMSGQMQVVRKTEPWQVVTNFPLSSRPLQRSDSECWRYNRAYGALQAAEGSVSEAEAMRVLDRSSQRTTMWSVVYDLADGSIQVAAGRRYDAVVELDLKMVSH
jgi:hypothetical protein